VDCDEDLPVRVAIGGCKGMQTDKQHGLIEWVVVAILAILAGLLLPALSRTSDTVRTIVYLNNISQPESVPSAVAAAAAIQW